MSQSIVFSIGGLVTLILVIVQLNVIIGILQAALPVLGVSGVILLLLLALKAKN